MTLHGRNTSTFNFVSIFFNFSISERWCACKLWQYLPTEFNKVRHQKELWFPQQNQNSLSKSTHITVGDAIIRRQNNRRVERQKAW